MVVTPWQSVGQDTLKPSQNMLLTFAHLKTYPYSMIQLRANFSGLLRALVVLAMGATALSAAQANFQFSGREGFTPNTGPIISGTLSLDLNDSGTVTPFANGENGSTATFLSSSHFLSGAFDLWSFNGTPGIYVNDGPTFWSGGDENYSSDYWIARTSVTGAKVAGWTPVFFGIYFYNSPAGINGAALLPPADPLSSANEYDFTFLLQLQDESDNMMDITGPIFSVQSVPEPTAFALLLLGGMFLRAVKRRYK